MHVYIYVILLGLVTLATLRRPAVALGALLCNYGLQQFVAGGAVALGAGWNTVTNITLASMLLLALVLLVVQQKGVLRRPPAVWWTVIGLYAWAAVSVIWSTSPASGFGILRAAGPTILVYAILGPLVIVEPRDLRAVFYTLLALGTTLMVLLTATAQYQGRAVMMGDGELGNPLALATLAGELILVAALMNYRGVARFWQVARWGVVAIALVVSIRSGSRGQFIGTLLMLVLFLPMSRQVRNLRGFIATAVGVALLLVLAQWAFGHYAEGRRWDYEEMRSAWGEARYDTALQVLQLWAQGGPPRWLIGLGGSESFHAIGYYPHLVLAEVIAEEGLVGLAFLVAMAYLSVRSALRLWRVVKPFPDARGLLAALLAILGFDVLMTFKSGSLLGAPTVFGFVLVLGFFEQAVQRHQATAALAAPALPAPLPPSPLPPVSPLPAGAAS